MNPDSIPPPSAMEDPGDLLDYGKLRDQALYGLHSVRRHRVLVSVIVVVVLGLAVVGLMTLPKTWRAETKLLAQKNQVMASIGNPGRAMPTEFDAPTRAAAETILNRDNLVALVRQTNLVERWHETRAPAVRFRDALMKPLRRQDTEEERIETLVLLLEKKLSVETSEGTVTIAVEWNDAQLAYRIVEAAQQNFLEARHVSEISTIVESISILESHAATVASAVNADIDELHRARETMQKGRGGGSVKRVARSLENQDLAQMRLILVAKRRAITDLEDFRRSKLAEMQAELTRQKAIYADQHPLVQDMQQAIDSFRTDSPQIAALRREIAELSREYQRRGGRTEQLDRGTGSELRPLAVGEVGQSMAQNDANEDPELTAMRTRLQFDMQKYNTLIDRVDSARVELDTARAAFKYRYSVIRPAQKPKVPLKPNPLTVLISSLIAGLILGVMASVGTDIASGRIFEVWQVERGLGLPVLAVVKRP